MNIRMHLIITGRVQGVCFRIATKKEAKKCKISGWVKNRINGTVETVLEGEEKQVELMVKWCKHGPQGANVVKVDEDMERFTGEFNGFKIIY